MMMIKYRLNLDIDGIIRLDIQLPDGNSRTYFEGEALHVLAVWCGVTCQ